MVLEVSLPQFNKKLDVPFAIFVDDCTIVQMSVVPPSTLAFNYEITEFESTLIIPRPTVTLLPAQCAFHGVHYRWTVVPMPDNSFATATDDGLAISSTDPQDAGTYTVELEVEPRGPHSVTPVMLEYQLAVTACRVNKVTVGTPQNDLTYYIGSGPRSIPGGFVSEQPGCEVTYSLEQVGMDTYDTDIFKFDQPPEVIIQTDSVDLHDSDIMLILKATSVESGDTAEQAFTVTFMDKCMDLILLEPKFSLTTATTPLFERLYLVFTESISDPAGCGAITYRLIDARRDTELTAPTFATNLDGEVPIVKVYANERMYADNSPYELVIEATLADYGISTRSDPLELYITNPCMDTNLLPEIIEDIRYRVEADAVTRPVPLFKDSVS